MEFNLEMVMGLLLPSFTESTTTSMLVVVLCSTEVHFAIVSCQKRGLRAHWFFFFWWGKMMRFWGWFTVVFGDGTGVILELWVGISGSFDYCFAAVFGGEFVDDEIMCDICIIKYLQRIMEELKTQNLHTVSNTKIQMWAQSVFSKSPRTNPN